jgi:hypothetical protein
MARDRLGAGARRRRAPVLQGDGANGRGRPVAGARSAPVRRPGRTVHRACTHSLRVHTGRTYAAAGDAEGRTRHRFHVLQASVPGNPPARRSYRVGRRRHERGDRALHDAARVSAGAARQHDHQQHEHVDEHDDAGAAAVRSADRSLCERECHLSGGPGMRQRLAGAVRMHPDPAEGVRRYRPRPMRDGRVGPAGLVCADVGVCGCLDPAVVPCGSAALPQCDGACPSGLVCTTFEFGCACWANFGPCGQSAFNNAAPACNGDCPTPAAPYCRDVGGSCACAP